jgi:hypothetical protein
MKKNIMKKIIDGVIIFTFVVFLSISILPAQASAVALDWSNPNKNGNNAYKFKPSDVLNSKTAMQVIGCTGVVDQVSTAITKFAKQQLVELTTKEWAQKAKNSVCQGVKNASMYVAGLVMNTTTTAAIGEAVDCSKVQVANDPALLKQSIKQEEDTKAAKRKEDCFNGIAINLAKNQLVSMTRYTMNWVNSGFDGNPLYVRNITSLTNSLEKGLIEENINKLMKTDGAYPYGDSFSSSLLDNYNRGYLKTGAINTLDSLTSDLSNFVSDPTSYPDLSATDLQKSKTTNNVYSKDFLSGGWDAWLAMTQKEANNPLGFTMKATEDYAKQQAYKSSVTVNEVTQNNGFLSQKTCTEWQLFNGDGTPKLVKSDDINDDASIDYGPYMKYVYAQHQNKNDINKNDINQDKCTKWDVVTPGSIIKSKLDTYINSPERQLELVKTINDALNSLFSNLISQFQNQGLSGLSSEKYQYLNNTADGYGNMGRGDGSNAGTAINDGSGSGYSNPNFDITHDLGNQFIHNYASASIGSWDALNNNPQLYIDTPPIQADGKTPYGPNVYYVVSKNGNTKLMNEAYNGWSVGDRAFWDGVHWQNWRKPIPGGLPTSPIAKRGVIQIQKDYAVVAKEILMKLPSIMPKIGELDYCIPGPNPNFSISTSDVQAKFNDFTNTLTAQFKKGSLFRRKSLTFSIAGPGDIEYDDYRNIFLNTTIQWWNAITSTNYWSGLMSRGNAGQIKGAQKKLDRVQKNVDDFLARINTDERTFNDVYSDFINHAYGPDSTMQKQFVESEPKIINPITDINPGWLPMSSEGLDITKDILSYNDKVASTAAEYKDGIVKANANIAKLTLIKNEVGKIILEAQGRRNTALLKILNDEAALNGTPVLTQAQYLAKYKSCLNEEEVTYYDDLPIIDASGGDEASRCSDGIDNDLNGLIDNLDPACKNFTPEVEPNYACVLDMSETFTYTDPATGQIDINPDTGQPELYSFKDDTALDPMPDDTTYCTGRTASNCTSNLYYTQGIGYKCMPTGNLTLPPSPSSTTTSSTTTTTTTGTTPSLSNAFVSSILTNSAIIYASVISLGTPAVISSRGVCYYKDGASPSTAICISEGGLTTGSFTLPIYPLTTATKYWYSAYADNASGRGYTPWLSFTTL